MEGDPGGLLVTLSGKTGDLWKAWRLKAELRGSLVKDEDSTIHDQQRALMNIYSTMLLDRMVSDSTLFGSVLKTSLRTEIATKIPYKDMREALLSPPSSLDKQKLRIISYYAIHGLYAMLYSNTGKARGYWERRVIRTLNWSQDKFDRYAFTTILRSFLHHAKASDVDVPRPLIDSVSNPMVERWDLVDYAEPDPTYAKIGKARDTIKFRIYGSLHSRYMLGLVLLFMDRLKDVIPPEPSDCEVRNLVYDKSEKKTYIIPLFGESDIEDISTMYEAFRMDERLRIIVNQIDGLNAKFAEMIKTNMDTAHNLTFPESNETTFFTTNVFLFKWLEDITSNTLERCNEVAKSEPPQSLLTHMNKYQSDFADGNRNEFHQPLFDSTRFRSLIKSDEPDFSFLNKAQMFTSKKHFIKKYARVYFSTKSDPPAHYSLRTPDSTEKIRSIVQKLFVRRVVKAKFFFIDAKQVADQVKFFKEDQETEYYVFFLTSLSMVAAYLDELGVIIVRDGTADGTGPEIYYLNASDSGLTGVTSKEIAQIQKEGKPGWNDATVYSLTRSQMLGGDEIPKHLSGHYLLFAIWFTDCMLQRVAPESTAWLLRSCTTGQQKTPEFILYEYFKSLELIE